MARLIVIADLGRIRTLQVRGKSDDPQERSHLVKETNTSLDENLASRGDVVTDQSGRFAQGGAADRKGGMSYGEQHNLTAEMERKAIEHLAEKIGEIVAEHSHPSWILAAPQPILPRLQAALPKASSDRLSNTLGADLTKLPIAKLEQRFVGE